MGMSLYCGVMVLDSGMSDDKAQCLYCSVGTVLDILWVPLFHQTY